MIENLTVINLKANAQIAENSGEVFILKTCQRTLLVGFGEKPFLHLRKSALVEETITDIFAGLDAYIFLLETITGLRSEVVAEYEVVGQFKEAYQEYSKLDGKSTQVMNVLEKVFQDNKKVRTEHLTEIGQLTYAGIARKLIHTRVSDGDVLVLGSGALAEDLIKLLKKKHNVFISARNEIRVKELSELYNLEVVAWGEKNHYAKFPFIVNTIGTDTILFNEDFFSKFFAPTYPPQMKLFIDLGSPSVIETKLTESAGVLRLEDIFRQSAKLNIEKMEKVKKAKEAILLLAEKRNKSHLSSIPFDWEELQVAYSL
jgi:glutamyl-tRNA reductase